MVQPRREPTSLSTTNKRGFACAGTSSRSPTPANKRRRGPSGLARPPRGARNPIALLFPILKKIDTSEARRALAVAVDHARVIGAIVGRRLENVRTMGQTTLRRAVAFLSCSLHLRRCV